jgi:hypothetical protein
VTCALVACGGCKFEPVSLDDLTDGGGPDTDPAADDDLPDDGPTDDPTTDEQATDVDPVFAACDATLYTASAPIRTNRQGFGNITVTVDGYQSMLVQAAPVDGAMIASYGISDENGDLAWSIDDWSSDEIWSGSPIAAPRTIINFPSRSDDGRLSDGDWTVQVVAVDGEGYGVPNADLDVQVFFKEDPDLTSSCLPVRVVYARGMDDLDTKAAVAAGFQRFQEIYASVGVSVILLEEETSSLPADLPRPGDGDRRYADVSADLVVTLAIGDTVDNSVDILGQAGGIPGAMTAGDQSVVAIAVWLHAGANGRFNDAELGSLGETMAHEVGHYLGLVHPVQYDGDLNVVAFDALDDTERCSSWERCDQLLGENLMYPYSGRSMFNLTDDQMGVMHRYVGVQ